MARIFSSSMNTFDRAFRTLGIMLIVALLVIVPFGVGGNEDLEVVDRFTGTTTNSKMGWNVTEVGDVDGDNIEDYIVGAPGMNMAYLFEGPMPKTFTTAGANWRISGPASSNFGWSVAGVGDYDGDNRDDVIIGAPGIDKAYIFRGRGSGSYSISYSSADIVLEGATGDLFGHSVGGIDYSNTSNYYAAVGAPRNTHFLASEGQDVSTGSVYLFNLSYMDSVGDDTANYTVANITFIGEKNNGWFGFTIENLGDINDDGIPDIAIGDPYYNNTGEIDNGALYIQYGKNIFLEVPRVTAGNMDGYIFGRPGSRLGWSVSALEDVSPNADLIDDFIIGAPFENDVGYAHLFYGTTGAIKVQLTATIQADTEFRGGNSGDRFGWALDRTMISGGSTFTITIGAPGYDNGTGMKDAGAAFCFWDWTTLEFANFSKSKYYGDNAGDNFGYAIGEVIYRTNSPDWIRIIASSPYHGSSDAGKIEILNRNRLPKLTELLFSPQTGNMNTMFEITMNYTDQDGDPPEFVGLEVYQDNLGSEHLLTLRLNLSHGTGYTSRMVYRLDTKLPNSILNKNTADKPLYFRGVTRALRGSRDLVIEGTMRNGPVVDGVAPSATDIYSATGQPGNNLDEGTFMMTFEWPEENALFQDTNGKVKRLQLALREGKDNPLTEENWNDTNPYDPVNPREQFNLSTGKTVMYRTFQFGDVQSPNTVDRDYIIGNDEIRYNPNYVVLKKMMNYSVAFRAEDEVGNWGPLSNVMDVETYWRRPDIPPAIDVFLKDDMEDMGGFLNLTWNPPQMLYPDDIDEYWFYVDTEPLGNITEFEKQPDYIINRKDDYESFFDTFLVIDHYFDADNQRQDLMDGQNYYAAGLALNWLGQHSGIMKWSSEAKVVGENEPWIAPIRGVAADNHGTDGHAIKLSWQASNDPKFVEYQIYGSTFSFSDIDDAVKIGTISSRTETEFIVDELSGEEVSQANWYFLAVLVKDHNGHMYTDIDVNNSVQFHPTAVPPPNDYPVQVKGVSLLDRGSDGGGVLSLSWFALFNPIMETTLGSTTGFWQYNIYFSDSPITDVTSMEPMTQVRDFRTRSMEIDNLNGDPLIDGKTYYVVVTMVDWNLVENPDLDENNMASKFPINQSDNTPPSFRIGDFSDANSDIPDIDRPQNNITIEWTPITETDVQDFQYYWIRWTGPRSGDKIIEDITVGRYTIEGLIRGDWYWVNITIVDLNDNIGAPSDSEKIPTGGFSIPPWNIIIQLNINEENFNYTDGGEHKVKEEDVYIVFFTGSAEDDFTSFNRLTWTWNITTPGGAFIEKRSRSWDLEIAEHGTYQISLVVSDDEGGDSPQTNFNFIVETSGGEKDWTPLILAIILIAVVIVAIFVVIFVMMSGKKSQQNQMIEQYEERKKDIETMEPIYTNLPTWTCDCGTTQVKLSENAYCNACYQSHEAVPIDNLDEYLREHDLVLTEMKVDIPPGWQGQDMAIEYAKKDLEERKERAQKALNEEFAIWLKGTQYESEIPVEEETQVVDQPITPASLHHEGAIIPGQMPPTSPAQAAPLKPMPTQPMPMGQQPPGAIRPGQPMPIQPIRPPVPGQPQQRPPIPPQQ